MHSPKNHIEFGTRLNRTSVSAAWWAAVVGRLVYRLLWFIDLENTIQSRQLNDQSQNPTKIEKKRITQKKSLEHNLYAVAGISNEFTEPAWKWEREGERKRPRKYRMRWSGNENESVSWTSFVPIIFGNKFDRVLIEFFDSGENLTLMFNLS